MTSLRVELAVLGGGVIGLAVAFEAARRGLSVAVVSVPRLREATPASGGMLAPASEAAHVDTPLLELAMESCRLYPELISGLERATGQSCGYRHEGSLLVALHRDHVEALTHLQRIQESLGLETEWLTAGQVRAREPRLSPRQVGALWAREDRQVDPRAFTAALREAIERSGNTLVEGAESCELRTDGPRVCGVRARVGDDLLDVGAPAVAVAAGVWSNDAVSEIPFLPLRPVKGQALLLRGEPLIDHVVRTPDVYLVPRHAGRLFVGASSEESGFELGNTAGAALDLLREAWRVLPGVYELEICEMVAGLRPTLRDHLPAIGSAGLEGLWLATGHYRHGVLLAAATAKLLVEAIVTGAMPHQLAPFSPARFS
jgi:glycine oxidase